MRVVGRAEFDVSPLVPSDENTLLPNLFWLSFLSAASPSPLYQPPRHLHPD